MSLNEIKMDEEVIQVTFDVSDLTNDFLCHIKQVMEGIAIIYNSIEASNVNFSKPLPTDNLPIIINDNKPPLSVEERKAKIVDWIVEKGFEETIVGINKILKKAYIFSSYINVSKLNRAKNLKELQVELNKIKRNSEKFHLPELIKNVEDNFGVKLKYREEIESINKVRACLVHRNGIVSEKDINSEGSLLLKWISIKSYALINGKETLINYELRKDPILVESLRHENYSSSKEFKLLENVVLDINVLNDIVNTCSLFAFDMRDSLKKGLGV